jgi:transcriptional regulator with XRE-family HTH domain
MMSIVVSIPAGTSRSRQKARAQDADRHVGRRLRERRITLDLTQAELAERLSITFQQLAKYERGINRISAGRLWALARALGVEVGWFFEGLAGSVRSETQDFTQDEVSAWMKSQREDHR